MTARQRERWGRQRHDGFWHFVVFEGALRFGPVAFVLQLLIREWAGGIARHGAVTVDVLVWTLVGLLWGAAVWTWQESRYAMVPAATPDTKPAGVDISYR